MLKWLYSILPEWRSSQLQRRFAYLSGGLLTVISLTFLLLLTGLYRERVLSARADAAQNVNALLETALVNAMLKRDIDGLEQILADLVTNPDIDGARIVNPEGQVRFGSGSGVLLDDPAVAAALQSAERQHGLRRGPDGRLVLRAVEPVHNQPRCAECHGPVAQSPINGLLVVDYPMGSLRGDLIRGVLVLGALGLAVMLAVQTGLWISLRRLVLDRAVALDTTARAFAEGDLSVRAQAGPEDEISRLGASFNDMAGQLQATLSALRGQKEFLQTLVDSIPDGIRVIGQDHRTLIVNRAFREQLRLPQEVQAEDLPCYALSHGRDTPCTPTMVRCPLVELSDDCPQIRCSHTHVAHDGARLRVEVQATRAMMQIDGAAQPCVIESVRDLETQVMISQEQRLAEMGMLASGMAHEVFNPLTSIALILDRLESQPLDGTGHELLRLARTEIANCRHVTDSLLKMAAPGADVAPLDPVDLGEILTDTALLLRFEAQQRGCQIAIEATSAPVVMARDSDLRMMVFNLLQNAIHAMPDGGPITLRAMPREDRVVIEVADRGVGIAAADRDRVLMPFWTRRADGSSGRGLGLAICAVIVSGLGGKIDFDSTPGEGTTFRVELPRSQGGA